MARSPTMLEPVFDGYTSGSPSSPVISLSEAKAHLRVDHSDEDSLINSLISAVVSHLDGYNGELGRCLLTQTWNVSYDCFPYGRRLRLPISPIDSAVITYYDANNVEQTFSNASYSAHDYAAGGYLHLEDAVDSWPGTYNRPDAVTVALTAGYGLNGSDVPQAIRQAALLILGHWYENRENSTEFSLKEIPLAANALLFNYRRHKFD